MFLELLFYNGLLKIGFDFGERGCIRLPGFDQTVFPLKLGFSGLVSHGPVFHIDVDKRNLARKLQVCDG